MLIGCSTRAYGLDLRPSQLVLSFGITIESDAALVALELSADLCRKPLCEIFPNFHSVRGIMISLGMDEGHTYTFRGCMISCNTRMIYSYAYR